MQATESEDIVEFILWSQKIVENPLGARSRYLEFLSKYTSTYLWNKDAFTLSLPLESISEINLTAKVRFGENIQDEWFIVFLLYELSKNFPELIIKVIDNDGEFLLIESADYLPNWIKPEIMDNRVFIYQGKLHIIPLPTTPAELLYIPSTPTLTLSTALSIIRKGNVTTLCDENIQNCIFGRINHYPKKIKEDMHNAKCYLPAQIVYLILNNRLLLSEAVNAYYFRDVDTVKHCFSMKKFGECEHVLVSVEMTRFLYAELSKQNMEIIPQSLRNQYSKLNYKTEDVNKWNKATDLGAKLSCGFEILYQESKLEGDINSSENLYDSCAKYLTQHGIEISENILKSYIQDENKLKEPAYKSIDSLLSNFNANPPVLPTVTIEVKDDNESWLTVSEEELDVLLKPRQEFSNVNSGNMDFNSSETLKNLATQMSSFMEKESDFEGIEPENEDLVSFDPNKFMSIMKNTLGLYDEDGPESEDSEEEEDEIRIDEQGTNEMLSIMSLMDKELEEEGPQIASADDSEVALNFDMVKNLLDSYSAQFGGAGPISNLLNYNK